MLVEIRRQEEILTQVEASTEEAGGASEESYTPGVVEGDSNQTTLFGGDV